MLDKALQTAPSVQHVIAVDRGSIEIDTPMHAGATIGVSDIVVGNEGKVATVEMQAEDPPSCSTRQARPANPKAAYGPISASSARW